MPQMSPINWFILFIHFVCILFVLVMFLHFNIYEIKEKTKVYFKVYKLKWFWLW